MARSWHIGMASEETIVDGEGPGTVEIAAAVATKQYRLLGWDLREEGGAAAEVNFEDGTTDLTGPIEIPQSGQSRVPYTDKPGGFVCTLGNALNLVVANTSAVISGIVYYDEVQDKYR